MIPLLLSKGVLVISTLRPAPIVASVLALILMAASIGGARAEAQLDARYRISLSLLPLSIANGSLKVRIDDTKRYVTDLSARGMGFAISAKSLGTIGGSINAPSSAAIDTRGGDEPKRSVRIAMVQGVVRGVVITPPIKQRPDRIPVSNEDQRGVMDPVSAMLLPMLPGKDPLAPAQCDRTLPIYEGSERFDITLSYDRTEKVKTVEGYEGSVLVCRARYKPISGHRPNRKQVREMEQNKTIEAWFAPVPDARVLAPWKVSLGTVVGTLNIEATRFQAGEPAKKVEDAPRPGVKN